MQDRDAPGRARTAAAMEQESQDDEMQNELERDAGMQGSLDMWDEMARDTLTWIKAIVE